MKRILNTLYITTQKVYVHKERETIVVSLNKKELLKIPAINLNSIVCFGNVRVSPFLLGHCANKGISISFMTEYGKFLCRVQGPVAGNVLLRKAQYRMSDSMEFSVLIARNVLIGKFMNCRTVVERALRDHSERVDQKALEEASKQIERSVNKVMKCNDLELMRGIEGDTAKIYFGVLDHLILNQKEDFFMKDRNRRPPMDRVNCILSFLYTLLYHDMRSALETTGLDPAVGFLHRDRPGRLSLSLDLMEEFRPVIADRLMLSLINLRQIESKDFEISDSGTVLMNEKARKTVLETYQKRKQECLEHPFIGETMHIGLLFHTQALLLARYIRGDLDEYPPFIWR